MLAHFFKELVTVRTHVKAEALNTFKLQNHITLFLRRHSMDESLVEVKHQKLFLGGYVKLQFTFWLRQRQDLTVQVLLAGALEKLDGVNGAAAEHPHILLE
jgi:hypothetical protein